MAGYALWLQHEASRAHTSPVYYLHKQGWYERRMDWFVKFMDVMDVREEDIAEAMRLSRLKEAYTETHFERIDTLGAAALFLRSVKTTRIGNTGT